MSQLAYSRADSTISYRIIAAYSALKWLGKMASAKFFQLVDEVGRDPRKHVERPKVFPNTKGLALDPVEQPWARWEGGTLGTSGVEVWRVRSTGHGINLVGANRWSYHLPLRGGMRLTFGRDDTEVPEGKGSLLGTRGRRTHVLPGRSGLFDGIVVLLDPAHMAIREDALAGDSGLVGFDGGGALSAYLRFLSAELLNNASSIHSTSALQAAGALLLELYRMAAFDTEETETASQATAGLVYVQRAEEIMRANFTEPLTIPGLAEEVGVGVRALQLAFAAHRKASPRALLNTMRLDAAHDALKSARPTDTVTTIAFDCGFAHLGRFSRAYAERFGETPSDTLLRRRLRQS